jgi:hypothetical protein
MKFQDLKRIYKFENFELLSVDVFGAAVYITLCSVKFGLWTQEGSDGRSNGRLRLFMVMYDKNRIKWYRRFYVEILFFKFGVI